MFTVNPFSSLLCNFIFLTFHILAFCAEFVNIFLYDKNILQTENPCYQKTAGTALILLIVCDE